MDRLLGATLLTHTASRSPFTNSIFIYYANKRSHQKDDLTPCTNGPYKRAVWYIQDCSITILLVHFCEMNVLLRLCGIRQQRRYLGLLSKLRKTFIENAVRTCLGAWSRQVIGGLPPYNYPSVDASGEQRACRARSN